MCFLWKPVFKQRYHCLEPSSLTQSVYSQISSVIDYPTFSIDLNNAFKQLNWLPNYCSNNVSKLSISCVPAEKPKLAPALYIATFSRTNLLSPFRHIAGSNAPTHCSRAAALEPQFTIGEPEVWIVHLASDMYMAWARYLRLNVTNDMLEILTVPKKRFLTERLYWL